MGKLPMLSSLEELQSVLRGSFRGTSRPVLLLPLQTVASAQLASRLPSLESRSEVLVALLFLPEFALPLPLVAPLHVSLGSFDTDVAVPLDCAQWQDELVTHQRSLVFPRS